MTRSTRVFPLPPQALIAAVSDGPPSPSADSGAEQKTAIRIVGLALLVHMLRSRRFYERAAIMAIVLAALAGLNQESRAKAFAGLVAWAKRQDERVDRKVKKR